MKPLCPLKNPSFYGLAYAGYREQLLDLLRLALHAEENGMPPLGEGIEHLLYKKWIHLRDIREFVDAQQVESRIVQELAVQRLSICVPV